MPRRIRIPASGYETLTNFVLQRTRSVKTMVGRTIAADAHSGAAAVTPIAANSYGDITVRPGTVLAVFRAAATGANSSFTPVAYPISEALATVANWTGDDDTALAKAVGILVEPLNLRDGDRISTILVDGWVDSKWLFYDGVKNKKPVADVWARIQADMANLKIDDNVGVLETNS